MTYMTKTLHVKVEDYHIRCGVPNSGGRCPVALAVEPMLPVGVQPVVTLLGVSGWDGKQFVSQGELPVDAARWISRFDKGEKVEPFEFDLTLNG